MIYKNEFLNAYQVKQLLEIPLSTVYHLTKTGTIKSVRIGKHIRYRKQDIDRYIYGEGFSALLQGKHENKERRSSPRINCDINCMFRSCLGRVSDGAGRIKNISADGFLLACDGERREYQYIRNDDPMKIDFTILSPGEEHELIVIKAAGRVTRIEDRGWGIKFRGLSEETREKIRKYVG